LSPTQILALIRDAAILGALGWVLWKVYADGEDRVKSQDLKAVSTQLLANQKVMNGWQEQQQNAEAQRRVDMANINAAITEQHQPVWVCHSGSPGALPSAPAPPTGGTPRPGGTEVGSGTTAIDIRAAVNDFEHKYENALSECRTILSSWPR